MNHFLLIGKIVLRRCMSWSNLYRHCLIGERLEHIFICLIIANRHNEIKLFILQQLFGYRAFVDSGDADFDDFIAVDDLQRCIPDKVMKIIEQLARPDKSEFR